MSCKCTGKRPGTDTNYWVPVWQPNVSYPEGALVAYLDYSPTLMNPMEDMEVTLGTEQSIVYLYNTFSDIDNDDILITADSSNNELIIANVTDKVLTLVYPTSQTGTALITLIATANEKTATDNFNVTISPVNLGPEVVEGNELPDVNVDQDTGDTIVDLSNLFSDPEGDSITITALSDSPSLVTASVVDTTLTLSYENGENGSALITVTATSTGGTASNIFGVLVNPV